MPRTRLRLARFFRVGAAVHAIALSGDGNLLLVGSEHDLRLLDASGRIHFRWGGAPVPGQWLDTGARPFSAVALAADLRAGLAVERAGRLHRLDFTNGDGEVSARATGICAEPNDLYSLDFVSQRGLIALGHLGPDVAVFDAAGQQLWRCQPAESENGGRVWSVAFGEDAATVYAGCMFPARFAREAPYLLAALDSETGAARQALALSDPITALAALSPPLTVATVQTHAGQCRIVAYGAGLGPVAWTHHCEWGEVVTALAADGAGCVLLAGTNTGRLWLLDASTGEVLAKRHLLYFSAVLSIGAAADAAAVAVGLANGHVAYLELSRQDSQD